MSSLFHWSRRFLTVLPFLITFGLPYGLAKSSSSSQDPAPFRSKRPHSNRSEATPFDSTRPNASNPRSTKKAFSLPMLAKDVVVKSDYTDGTKIQGTGALIEVPWQNQKHFFMLTAAHVSQGENLQITINGKTIRPLSNNARIWDARRDIELIEVDAPSELLPLARLMTPTKGSPYLKTDLESSLSTLRVSHTKSGEDLKPFYVGFRSDEKTKLPLPYPSYLIASGAPSPERAENLGHWQNSKPDLLDYLQESLYGDTWFTPALGLIAQGMSGAPLIQSHRIDGHTVSVLDGVAIQFLRFGSKSYFAKSQTVIQLLQRYFKGTRGPVNQYQWQMKDGRLFREFCFYWRGTCLAATEDTEGPRGPGGGGVRGDGGAGVRANGDLSFLDHSMNPSLDQLGASIKVNNHLIYGFQARRRTAEAKPFFIEANLAGIEFVEKNQSYYEFEMIKEGFVARDLFLQRLQNGTETSLTLPLDLNYRGYPHIRISIDRNKMDFQLPLGLKPQAPEGSQPSEIITFSLDEWGGSLIRRNPRSGFTPIIEVRGMKKKQRHYIDLRQLFFLDLSELPRDLELYASVMHIDAQPQAVPEFIEAVFARGGLLTIRLAEHPDQQAIVQFYLPHD